MSHHNQWAVGWAPCPLPCPRPQEVLGQPALTPEELFHQPEEMKGTDRWDPGPQLPGQPSSALTCKLLCHQPHLQVLQGAAPCPCELGLGDRLGNGDKKHLEIPSSAPRLPPRFFQELPMDYLRCSPALRLRRHAVLCGTWAGQWSGCGLQLAVLPCSCFQPLCW